MKAILPPIRSFLISQTLHLQQPQQPTTQQTPDYTAMDPSHVHALTPYNEAQGSNMSHRERPVNGDGSGAAHDSKSTPMSIATISSGFEKGDFLVSQKY